MLPNIIEIGDCFYARVLNCLHWNISSGRAIDDNPCALVRILSLCPSRWEKNPRNFGEKQIYLITSDPQMHIKKPKVITTVYWSRQIVSQLWTRLESIPIRPNSLWNRIKKTANTSSPMWWNSLRLSPCQSRKISLGVCGRSLSMGHDLPLTAGFSFARSFLPGA
jgi:hypothetical protein